MCFFLKFDEKYFVGQKIQLFENLQLLQFFFSISHNSGCDGKDIPVPDNRELLVPKNNVPSKHGNRTWLKSDESFCTPGAVDTAL